MRWRVLGAVVLVALVIMGAYKLDQWVNSYSATFSYSHGSVTSITTVSVVGWGFFKLTWPFVILGVVMGAMAAILFGYGWGLAAAWVEYRKRRDELVKLKQHVLQRDKVLTEDYANKLREVEKRKQEQDQAQAAAKAELAKREQALQVARQQMQEQTKRLQQAEREMATKIKAAFAERDSARHRAKRLQEEVNALKGKTV